MKINKTKLIYYKKRYKDLKSLYLGKTNHISSIRIFIDYLTSYFLYGASINDYFAYNFYNLRHRIKSEYLTAGKHKELQKICNPNKDDILILRDKIKFNEYFSNYLGRKWIAFKNLPYDEFSRFLDSINGDKLFIKDVEGLCGKGIQLADLKNTDRHQLYDKLKKDKTRYLLEEPIIQVGELAEFNPSSINTIRITTIYDDKNDIVHLMKANLRIGRKGESVDNLKSGGIATHIDIETGIIDSPGFDDFNNTYIYHPDSHKQIVGFKIPFWEECKSFITNIAKMIPEVRYIGWDIVSVGDGSFLLIEGNDNGGPNMQQYKREGIWPKYKDVLKELK